MSLPNNIPPTYEASEDSHIGSSSTSAPTPQPQTATMDSSLGNEKSPAYTEQSHNQRQYQSQPQQYQEQPQDITIQPMQHQATENKSQPGLPPQQQSYTSQGRMPVGASSGNPNVIQKNNYANAVPLLSLQKTPAVVDCPVCGQREMTSPIKQSGGATHASAALCCLCLCLGCVPYLFGEFKDTLHKCGSCQAHLALYHRSGHTEVLVRGAA